MTAGLVLWLGLLKTVVVLLFASLVALILFFSLLGLKKVNWKWMIPFGPFLALGTFVIWFFPGLLDQLNKYF